jgi:hypothetical protein
MSLYEQLKSAGVPLDSHESDLYAKVTPESTAIIEAWHLDRPSVLIGTFRSDGAMWYDIPFEYKPFWVHMEVVALLLELVDLVNTLLEDRARADGKNPSKD